jgi:hypothetical protein
VLLQQRGAELAEFRRAPVLHDPEQRFSVVVLQSQNTDFEGPCSLELLCRGLQLGVSKAARKVKDQTIVDSDAGEEHVPIMPPEQVFAQE